MLNTLAMLLLLAAGPTPPDLGGADATPVTTPQRADAELPRHYEPLSVGGFHAMIRSGWESQHPVEVRRVLAALETDLAGIEAVVPGPSLAVLRERVTIWISPSLEPREGFSGRGMCFHESEAWVSANGLGAERFRGVEICNAGDYLLWRAEQPMMVLHEMAHAYHEAIRPGDGEVRAAFEHAVAEGRYEHVRHVLAGPGELRRAYALNNDREYFAELTEAYFGRNDFGPVTREELRDLDPMGFGMIERAWSHPPARSEPGGP